MWRVSRWRPWGPMATLLPELKRSWPIYRMQLMRVLSVRALRAQLRWKRFSTAVSSAEAATLSLWWWAAVIAAVVIGFWVWWVRWRRPRADNWHEPPIAEPTAVVVPPVEPGAALVETTEPE